PSNTNVPTNGAVSQNSSISVIIKVDEAHPSSRAEFSPAYMDLGDCHCECRPCGGLFWLFRTARDRCNASEIPGFKIRLYNLGGVRGYELPTSDVLGAIVFEDGPRSQINFDVIIEFRGGPPKRISKLHQSYMSL
ncbi:hypothetical protein Tco_0048300, partial [Tanacetum coccineum]